MLSSFTNGEINNDGHKHDTKGKAVDKDKNSSQQQSKLSPNQSNPDQGKKRKKKGKFKNRTHLFSRTTIHTPQSKPSDSKATTTTTKAEAALHNPSLNETAKQDQRLSKGKELLDHGANNEETRNVKNSSYKTSPDKQASKVQSSKQAVAVETPVLPSQISFQGIPKSPQVYKSPRKEVLTRQKQNEQIQNNKRVDLRDHLKPKDETNVCPSAEPHHEDLQQPVSIMMEDKVTLFKYKLSNIVELPHKNDKSGSLLAHGEFEIFQLLNGSVTCLSCGGKSFIYPLLPKIKIFRISFNQFLMPMLNPERYWRITIDTEENNVLAILEGTLERNVNYIHVSDSTVSDHSPNAEVTEQENGGNTNDESGLANSIDAKPRELMKSPSPQNKIFPTIIDTEIPESPPSAPISPTHSPIQQFELSPKATRHHATSLLKKSSQQSLSTNVACLDWNNNTNSQPNQQLKPRRSFHSNPYRTNSSYDDTHLSHNHEKPGGNTAYHQNNTAAHTPSHIKTVDEQSEGSMDSLLDEFEQNIARTVRNPSVYSRPVSRLQSVTSHHNPVPTYSRGKYFHGNIDRDEEEEDEDDADAAAEVYEDARAFTDRRGVLPNGSSIHGDATRNGGEGRATAYTSSLHDRGLHSARSRRSSRSDLYTNESGWMEPNLDASTYQKTPIRGSSNVSSSRLPKSRSNYSISSSASNGYNLGNIYRSVIGQSRRASYYSQYQYQNQNQPLPPSHNMSSASHQQSQPQLHLQSYSQSVRNGHFDNNNLDARSTTKSMSRLPTTNRQSDISRRRQSTYFGSNANQSINGSVSGSIRNNNSNSNRNANANANANVNVKLNSNEIYQLLSSKDEPKRSNANLNANANANASTLPKSTSFTSRLFGW
ncbi:INP1 [Candida margitis]|uniref:INP1 n=1 Tax=Candida margitis TaxID=1775924 RepID=UPI002225BB29|nr:INP1 [Candida margitis]KAI5970187.1 INP1 [Candida margitis]